MNKFEVTEKYIDGELGGIELLDFEKLLSNNKNIKRDYNLSLEINKSIIEDDVLELRETMNNIYKKSFKVKRDSSVFTKRRFYYAAASVALLVATGGLVQRLSGPDLDNIAVFEKYYAPYDATITYRSGNTEIDKTLLRALESYEESDYEQALILFEEVLNSRKDDMAVNLYSGISYMEEEKYQKASTSFNSIIKNNDNLFIEQAKWYLAMCYIKTDKGIDAKNILNELINEEGYYKKQAKRVLKDIED